ncbi:MAG: hypothetical protein KTR30_16445 [Saprospiraceae bacterium]|nr:hypothetical protein [Saprospiraceae bacterium]
MTNTKNTPTLLLFICLFLGACQQKPSAFDRWLAKYELDEPLAYFEQSPDSFYVVAPSELLEEVGRMDRTYEQLETLKDSILPQSHWSKRRSYLQEIDSLKEKWSSCRQDPSLYNLPGYCKKLLTLEDISLPEKLGYIQDYLKDSEVYYEAAKQLVDNPLPNKTLLAIQKQVFGLSFLQKELSDSLYQANLVPELRQSFRTDLERTRLAVKDYLAYCESLYFELNEDWGRE